MNEKINNKIQLKKIQLNKYKLIRKSKIKYQ